MPGFRGSTHSRAPTLRRSMPPFPGHTPRVRSCRSSRGPISLFAARRSVLGRDAQQTGMASARPLGGGPPRAIASSWPLWQERGRPWPPVPVRTSPADPAWPSTTALWKRHSVPGAPFHTSLALRAGDGAPSPLRRGAAISLRMPGLRSVRRGRRLPPRHRGGRMCGRSGVSSPPTRRALGRPTVVSQDRRAAHGLPDRDRSRWPAGRCGRADRARRQPGLSDTARQQFSLSPRRARQLISSGSWRWCRSRRRGGWRGASAARLAAELELPGVPRVDFAWRGTAAMTRDALPALVEHAPGALRRRRLQRPRRRLHDELSGRGPRRVARRRCGPAGGSSSDRCRSARSPCAGWRGSPRPRCS